MRQAQKISVRRVPRLARGSDRQTVGLAILDHLQPTRESLDELRVSPGRVNFDIRINHVRGKLHSHLVVAPACRAMKHYGNAALPHILQYGGDRNGPRDAGRIPVTTFIPRLRLDHLQPRLGQRRSPRHNHSVRSAAPDHPVRDSIQILLVRLTQVHREPLHLEPVLSQPVRHRAAIQPPGHRPPDHTHILLSKFAPVHYFCGLSP